MKLIFEKGSPGRRAVDLPKLDVPQEEDLLEARFLREELDLPEVGELDVVRHYTELSRRNFGVDQGFYPLGSCTMKYNPKVNEDAANLPGFTEIHPYHPKELCQGALKVMHELGRSLSLITGMAEFTLQPAAGAHGELTALMMIKAHFRRVGEKRSKVLIPDTAHGTNPASAAMCGFECVQVRSNGRGNLDLEDLRGLMTGEVAALMLTNPNTLGLFDEHITEIADVVHSKGGIFYCDGANANAVLGLVRFGDLGFDMVHLNLHKTFSTPHGGGGPGGGALGVKEYLVRYLPVPTVEKERDRYRLNYDKPDSIPNFRDSIGRVRAFYGNFGIMVRAYSYLRAIGESGLREIAENAVLNANYMMHRLKDYYDLPYQRTCQHEFVLSDRNLPNGVTANDLAKRLLDFGFYAPTIYFPLTVPGAIMIEPTETESKETLDRFIDAMIQIAKEARGEPETVKTAPHKAPVDRLDAVVAARRPVLRWRRE